MDDDKIFNKKDILTSLKVMAILGTPVALWLLFQFGFGYYHETVMMPKLLNSAPSP